MKRNLLRILSLSMLLPILPAFALPVEVEAAHPTLTSIFAAKTFTDEEITLPYRIYVPEDYDPAKSYPLIMFFHGAGERGNDNALQLKNAVGQMFNSEDSPVYQSIVVAPQCPAGQMWVNVNGWSDAQYSTDALPESQALKAALGLMESVQREYSVDTDRIYSTGLSMGGYATWDLLVRHTDLFAAAIPICGGADYRYAERLVNVPIYTFHGLQDPTVPYQGTEKMVNAIRNAGGEKITYVPYPEGNHLIWEEAFATEGLFEWLLSQRLSDRTGQLPPENNEEIETSTTAEESTPAPEESTTPETTALPDTTDVPEESTIPENTTTPEETEILWESFSSSEHENPPPEPSNRWLLPALICAGITAAVAGVCVWMILKKKHK